MHNTAMKIMFKDLKPEMYLITKQNSLRTSQKERCFPTTVPSRLNGLRANDRWVCWQSIAGVLFPGSEVAGALRLLSTSNSDTMYP